MDTTLIESSADIGYQGFITAEILPKPDRDQTPQQAARFLLGCLNRA